MTRSNRLFSVLLLATVAACGGDDGPATQPDAGPDPDAGPTVDAAPDPDGPIQPADCDYSESSDANNDTWFASGTPEAAGTLATTVKICGQIDSTHYDAQQGVVDVDAFTVTVPEGPVYATLTGPGLENLSDVLIGVYGGDGFTQQVGSADFVGGYALFEIPSLAAGTYEFSVVTGNAAAAAAAIPYSLQIHVDTRCPKITADADHTEGTDDGANDVFVIDYNAEEAVTPTPAKTDAPEATGLTIGIGDAKRISAALAEVPVVGSYKDVDTFEFTTGADVNQVQIRLNWDGMNDLDWYLFDTTGTSVATASFIREGEAEFVTARVQPNTTYWLWTGLYEDYTGPTPYNLSVCGAQFTP